MTTSGLPHSYDAALNEIADEMQLILSAYEVHPNLERRLLELASMLRDLRPSGPSLPVGPGGWVKVEDALPGTDQEVIVTDGVGIWKSRVSMSVNWTSYEPGCSQPVRWMAQSRRDATTGGT